MGRIHRRIKQSGVYFVTTDTWQRRQIFQKAGPSQILLDQLLSCRERGFYKLHAFVIMPEHLHLLITPSETSSLEKAVMIKGGASHRIKRELHYSFPIWMEGFHDRWIRDLTEHRLRKQYIELNPVKGGLANKPQDYLLGSASGRYTLDASSYDQGASGAEALDAGALNVTPKGVTHKAPSGLRLPQP